MDPFFQFPAEEHLFGKINKRQLSNSLRELQLAPGLVDFCSNDYLGLSRSETLKQKLHEFESRHPFPLGATGARLLSGNSALAQQVEKELAEFFRSPASLLFSSGYDANTGLFSAIPGKGDVVLCDEYIHASVHDGLRMGFSASYKFRHNDVRHLEEMLDRFRGKNVFVAVESVYSMDGDFAPLESMVDLCQTFHANLIVDEAHATGVFGPEGAGRVVELGLQDRVFLRVHTFGKALGTHGAAVACTAITQKFLINFSRPFVYSTALPFRSLAAILCSVDLCKGMQAERDQLQSLIRYFVSRSTENKLNSFLPSGSPVQSLVIGGTNPVKSLSLALRESGFDIRAILSPTVPAGKERLRVCLHHFNTTDQVDNMLNILAAKLWNVHTEKKLNRESSPAT